MKRRWIYILAVLLSASCSQKQAEQKTETPAGFASLKERSGELAKTAEWPVVQEKARVLLEKIQAQPNDIKSKLLLAQLYMQEARITGDHPYYYPAALAVLDDVLEHDPVNFEGLAFRSSVLLSQHRFREALETGSKAKNINSNNGFIFGVLCDANVELGNYEEAVKMSDQMQSIRPGLEAYSRASYLREMYGDNKGAIEAMKMAWKAGMPGSEEASWAGVTLAKLYENNGDLSNAENTCKLVLEQRPSYAFATAGLARIEKAKGNHDKAITLFEKAIQMMPEASFYEDLAAVYKAKGNQAKATELYTKVINILREDAASGHQVDMELAQVYLEIGETENALKCAKAEYERRPENIDANSTLAWVLYKKGEYGQAQQYMKTATRTGKQDAELLYRAGLVENAAGNKKAAEELNRKAMRINKYLPVEPRS